MSILIRAVVLGFIIVAITSYFFGAQVSQQAALVNNDKEMNEIMAEQEQRNCQQVINSKACTAPTDRGARWICSKNLSDFNCKKHVDVGYLILEEHQSPLSTQQPE